MYIARQTLCVSAGETLVGLFLWMNAARCWAAASGGKNVEIQRNWWNASSAASQKVPHSSGRNCFSLSVMQSREVGGQVKQTNKRNKNMTMLHFAHSHNWLCVLLLRVMCTHMLTSSRPHACEREPLLGSTGFYLFIFGGSLKGQWLWKNACGAESCLSAVALCQKCFSLNFQQTVGYIIHLGHWWRGWVQIYRM